jgi:hypothetical protein
MDIFMLYLLMQADTISAVLVFFALFGGAAIFLWITFAYTEDLPSKKIAKMILIFAWFPLVIASALFPNTKTIAVMVGGHYAIEATKSETAKKIIEYVNRSLDKALKDDKK